MNMMKKIKRLRKHEMKREVEIRFRINLQAQVVNKASTVYIVCTKFKNSRMWKSENVTRIFSSVHEPVIRCPPCGYCVELQHAMNDLVI